MADPTPEQIVQLFAIHNGEERRRENLMRSYGFDTTRSWVSPDGYRLSDRIWRARRAVRDQIDLILRQAIANGTDALEVADILEQYLNPQLAPVRNALGRLIRKQKPMIVTRAPGRGGMGSFSARRLARTEITRAHGVATIEAAKRTPFAVGVKWSLSGRHPKSDPCDENARRDAYKLGAGVYPPEQVPAYPNHPMCLCTLSTATESDVDAVVDRLREQYGLADGGAAPGPIDTADTERRITDAQFDSEGAAVAWRQGAFRNLARDITPGELDAVGDYRGSGYHEINRFLRKGEAEARQFLVDDGQSSGYIKRRLNEIPDVADRIDRAVARATLDRDVVLWRGMSTKSLGDLDRLTGTIITDNGFASTSLHQRVADSFVGYAAEEGKDAAVVRILAPRGANALPVDTLFGQSWEEEFLLPRGSRFRVISVNKAAGDAPVITVEIVP